MSMMMMSSDWISLNSFFTEIWAVNWRIRAFLRPSGTDLGQPLMSCLFLLCSEAFSCLFDQSREFLWAQWSVSFFWKYYSGLLLALQYFSRRRESEEQQCPRALTSCRTGFLWFLFRGGFPSAAVPCFAFCKCLLADGLLASKIHLFPLKVLLSQVCQTSVRCSTSRGNPAAL